MMKCAINLALGILLRLPRTLRQVIYYVYVLPLLLPVWIANIVYYQQVTNVLRELFADAMGAEPLPLDMSEMDTKRSIQGMGNEIVVAGLKLRSRGKRWKAPMVFLHGFPDSPWCWHHQVDYFAKLGYCCIAVTLPGYASAKSGDFDTIHEVRDFTTSTLTEYIEQLIIDIRCEDVILVAHDWGGMLAWTLAARSPQLVRKLIIMDCPHPKLFISNLSVDQLIKSFYFLLFHVPFIPEAYIRADGFDFVRRLVQFDRSVSSSFTDRDILIMQHFISQRGVLTNALNYYRNIFNVTLREWSVYERQIDIPTLVLWGSEDAALRPDLNDGLSKVCTDAEYDVLKGCSHWTPQDRPQQVNEYMKSFLDKPPKKY